MNHTMLLQVLHGEATPETLPAEQRERVEASLSALRTACAVAAPDRQKLLAGLRQIDARRDMKVIRARPPILRYAAIAALIAIAVGAMLLAASPTLRQIVWGHNPEPRTTPSKLQQSPDGTWSYAAGPKVHADRPGNIVIDESQALALKSGEADLSTEGVLREPLTLLSALDRAVNVSVSGPSKCTVRVNPDKKMLALSIFAGGPESVRVAKPAKSNDSFEVSGGANTDIIVQLASVDGAKNIISRWADVRETLPPICPGEVYLNLNNGRLLRGIVTSSSPNGILLTLPGVNAAVPESILNSEVSGWAPAESPRGRKAYAGWLNTSIPEQFRTISRQWIEYLAQREVKPDQAPATFTLPVAAFPDVTYSMREADGNLYFVARPADGLGAAWQLDEHGKVAPESSSPPPKQDF